MTLKPEEKRQVAEAYEASHYNVSETVRLLRTKGLYMAYRTVAKYCSQNGKPRDRSGKMVLAEGRFSPEQEEEIVEMFNKCQTLGKTKTVLTQYSLGEIKEVLKKYHRLSDDTLEKRVEK